MNSFMQQYPIRHRASHSGRLIAVLGVMTLAGCADQVATPDNSQFGAPRMDIVSGNNQSAPAGKMLPEPVVVKVTNASGVAVAGQVVNFKVISGGGKVFAGVAITNASGIAKERWNVGTSLTAVQRLDARAVDVATGDPLTYATFNATVGSPPSTTPVAFTDVTPASASVAIGGTVQLSATMRDSSLNVLSGRSVTWLSQNTARATVSSAGLVTGVAAGAVGVIGTSEGQADTAAITVLASAPAPVATVVITPSSSAISAGSTVQLSAVMRDANGVALSGRAVAWASRNAAVATVSSSGLVTGVSAGTAGIMATSETKADTSVSTVSAPPPPPPSGNIANPTLLPLASGARPVTGTYGRNISAGQTYADPNTGVTVLKVTDASTPTSNSGMDKGYSEGGPHISQPWTGTDGQTYYTLKVADRLVDLRYGTLALTNWRNVGADGEVDFAFSLNPATPRIGYTIEDNGTKRVSRYNTATNQIENTGNWPWIASASGTSFEWLQNNLNDKWFVGMLNSNHTVVAFRPSDGFQRSFTQSATGLTIDEPHIDRELPYVYLSTSEANQQNVVGFLETGATRTPANSSWQSDDHAATLRGMVTGIGHWERNKVYYYDVVTNTTVEYANAPQVIGYPGDWHMAGQWVFNNGTGPGQWFVVDPWGSDFASASIRVGMIGIVRMSPFSARILAAHDSQPSSYESQPQSTISPDGKLVMWTSNMGGKARTDVFVARMPVN
jgi:hypothetical protein